MSNQEIVQKLWNLCNVLRDDGITYHQYVTELTYILFLKMLEETNNEKSIKESLVGLEALEKKDAEGTITKKETSDLQEKREIADYSWKKLVSLSGIELKEYYNKILRLFGTHCTGSIKSIYHDARSNIGEPRNLDKIITQLDKLDWYSVDEDGFGDLYEGLLEKNANEKKSGAGQYFTPRVLIDVITELVQPKLKEKCNDPACGTFGFMIAAHKYVEKKHNDMFAISEEDYEFHKNQAFTGCELVPDTHRLALMNAMIHGIRSDITNGDTLSNIGKDMNNYDVVMANPPFGTKKGGERITRDDFLFPSSNKQLNFLQHIYRSLKKSSLDKSSLKESSLKEKTFPPRGAVVLPDNVLFADGDGTKIRCDLMDKCNLHTILRLPTGIFYAQGVKTNVLFFTRGKTDKNNTDKVYFYDMRTNMPSFGKTTPLKEEHFKEFKETYFMKDEDKDSIEKWTGFTRQEIEEKNNSLDLGLMRDDSIVDYEDLQNPIESGEEIIEQLEEAVDLIKSVVKELKTLMEKNNA